MSDTVYFFLLSTDGPVESLDTTGVTHLGSAEPRFRNTALDKKNLWQYQQSTVVTVPAWLDDLHHQPSLVARICYCRWNFWKEIIAQIHSHIHTVLFLNSKLWFLQMQEQHTYLIWNKIKQSNEHESNNKIECTVIYERKMKQKKLTKDKGEKLEKN